ncbi:hypothetical protein [Lewinella sp. W8]|uniref:hypothetical protein n=1 Tax=Lewinella sp. W8 TaxID=2528208 RepID=UPI0010675AC1|nr:hypothetical protein [Lewinella sp. W8]MTB50348.1 hypothetical protein [Lewinella sp. W8]
MARNISLGILGLLLIFLLLQLIGSKYNPQPFWGVAWIVLAIAPVFLSVLLERRYFSARYLLFYALLLLVTMIAQGPLYQLQGLDALPYLKMSFAWVLPAQGLLWFAGRDLGRKRPATARPAPLDPEVVRTIHEELLPQDLTEEALKLLAAEDGLFPDERKTLKLIQARNSALQQKIIKNLIEPSEAGRERAKINDALLTLIEHMG